jgi:hypothetical protein
VSLATILEDRARALRREEKGTREDAMSENESPGQSDEPLSPEDEETEFEAHGVKEVMSVGLAAAAIAGAAGPVAKAATGPGTDAPAAAMSETKALDTSAEYGLGELEAVGYKVSLDEIAKAGFKLSLDELDAVGYKVSLDELDKAGMKMDESTIMLKWRVDEELDAALVRVDQATEYSLKELAAAGFRVSVDELEAAGYKMTRDELDAVGYKMSWHESVGFKYDDPSIVSLKRGVDVELDTLLQEWPSKVSRQ